MIQLSKDNKEVPSGKPIKPKKPMPTKEGTEKIPVPCGLTEERVREIAREEIIKWEEENFIPLSID